MAVPLTFDGSQVLPQPRSFLACVTVDLTASGQGDGCPCAALPLYPFRGLVVEVGGY